MRSTLKRKSQTVDHSRRAVEGIARIAAVESKLGGVDAAAARRPLIEDRFVF